MNRVDMGGVFENMLPRSDVSNFLSYNAPELKPLFFYNFEFTPIQNKAMGGNYTEKADDCANRKDGIVAEYIVQLLPLIIFWIFILLPQLLKDKGDDDD